MKQFIFSIVFIASFTSIGFSQIEQRDAVPKEYSLEFGMKYIASSSFENKANKGASILFDYAWKLSGFNRKNESYITVPIGYTVLFPNTERDSKMSILSYGWTIRHEIRKDKKVIPFFGYALLLNQLRVNGMEGTVFGHQTKFDFGFLFNTKAKINYFSKIEYSFTRYPSLGSGSSEKIHAFDLVFGIRY